MFFSADSRYVVDMSRRTYTSKPSALSQALGGAFAQATLEAAARAEVEGLAPVGLRRRDKRAPSKAMAGVAEGKVSSPDFKTPRPKTRRRVKG